MPLREAGLSPSKSVDGDSYQGTPLGVPYGNEKEGFSRWEWQQSCRRLKPNAWLTRLRHR
jgi:hypothetical protein